MCSVVETIYQVNRTTRIQFLDESQLDHNVTPGQRELNFDDKPYMVNILVYYDIYYHLGNGESFREKWRVGDEEGLGDDGLSIQATIDKLKEENEGLILDAVVIVKMTNKSYHAFGPEQEHSAEKNFLLNVMMNAQDEKYSTQEAGVFLFSRSQ